MSGRHARRTDTRAALIVFTVAALALALVAAMYGEWADFWLSVAALAAIVATIVLVGRRLSR